MKQFVPEWLFGMQLLSRLVIMLFCVVAGPALSLVAHFGLAAFGVQISPPTVVITQLFSVIVCRANPIGGLRRLLRLPVPCLSAGIVELNPTRTSKIL